MSLNINKVKQGFIYLKSKFQPQTAKIREILGRFYELRDTAKISTS
ncbi:hypothetical protein [Campylobacter majalis]